jgi:elongation factor 1 alpha-like protein
MRVGTIAVRAELSPTAAHITDKQIQEALWNYYYDIEQSVRYLTSTYLSKQKSTKKDNPKLVQKAEGGLISISDAGSADYAGLLAVGEFSVPGTDIVHGNFSQVSASKSRSKSCTKPLSFAEFFRDTPWLNVPLERQGSFVAPLLPRGGLLGGSSGGPPKMSKLQALAAARKKKAQEQKSSQGVGVEKPMANLSLSGFNQKSQSEDKSSTEQTLTSKSNTRGFPLRKRKNSDPHEKILAPGTEGEPAPSNYNNDIEEPHLNQATPSAFANTMFRTTPQALPPQHPNNFFSLPYAAAATIATHDPFAGPSPDDVVIAAQSKGSTMSVRPQK